MWPNSVNIVEVLWSAIAGQRARRIHAALNMKDQSVSGRELAANKVKYFSLENSMQCKLPIHIMIEVEICFFYRVVPY